MEAALSTPDGPLPGDCDTMRRDTVASYDRQCEGNLETLTYSDSGDSI